MHMKQILLASAAAMVMAGTAFAAEPLLEPLPPAAPAVEPFVVPSWAGTYVGADIGWGWADIDDNGIFTDGGLFDDDDDDADGLVGGVFAGWLGQSGTFLYGVELFAQIADIDGDDDFFDDGDFFFDGTNCFFDADGDGTFEAGEESPCSFQGNKVHALFGLDGMIGWGGERTAFLLHAGPALGWFQRDEDFVVAGATATGDDDDIELGLSVAAEGRFKLTETVFAGVIGRAFWFPDVGDDNDSIFDAGDDTDVTVFEVKARLGMQFGGVGKAAPLDAGF